MRRTILPQAGTMREDVGGGVFNALRTVVRRGVSASLMSVRGGDTAGETVARTIAQAAIKDLSVTFLDRATPSYTAILDSEGELVVGFADMGLYDLAFPKQMRRANIRGAVEASDAVLCDANLPTAALERLMALAADRPAAPMTTAGPTVLTLSKFAAAPGRQPVDLNVAAGRSTSACAS